MGVERVLHLPSVTQEDVASGVTAEFGVVGDEDDGSAFGMQLLEEDENLEGGARVKVSSGFVRKDDRRVVDQGAGDGDTLHLSAAHLVALMLKSVTQSDGFQCLDRPSVSLLGGNASVVHEGEFDIFDSRGLGEQVVVLEDKTNFAVAQYGTFIFGHLARVVAVKPVGAVGGDVKTSENVQHGGFATAGSAHDGDELTLLNIETDATQRMDGFAADREVAFDVFKTDYRSHLVVHEKVIADRLACHVAA